LLTSAFVVLCGAEQIGVVLKTQRTRNLESSAWNRLVGYSVLYGGPMTASVAVGALRNAIKLRSLAGTPWCGR
jgi:hypothetical protein